MMKPKSTKRALLTSALALLCCVSMFVGTTFAWFTDSVTSGKNTIQSGNLDVALYYAASAEGPWTEVTSETDVFGYTNWEPGHTRVAYFKVVNEGSLALKYQLTADVYNETPGVNKDGETFYLSDSLYTKVVEAGAERDDILASTDGVQLKDSYAMSGERSLLEDEEDVIGLAIWMPTTVGNEANHNGTDVPAIEFGINLIATQYTYEKDSFDDQYDANAMYPGEVGTEAELATALAEGGSIKLVSDISTEKGFSLGSAAKDIVLDLNGHTLTTTGEKAKLFSVGGDADMTIYGGKLVAASTNGQVAGTGTSTGASTSVYFWSSGDLTMTDVEIEGSVRGGHRAVEVFSGNAVLTNVDITTSYGTGVNVGGNGDPQYAPAVAVLNDCDITVTGMYSTPYNSVCFSVMNGGDLTINSGNYKLINNATYSSGDTHGGWVGIVMNSGGTLTINGGTYTNVPAEGFKPANERAVICVDRLPDVASTLNLYGGTFDPQATKVYQMANGSVLNGAVIDNGDGTWTAVKGVAVSDEAGLADALASGADTVVLAAGNYTIPSAVAGKTVTLIGSGDGTVIDFTKTANVGGANITFENMKFQGKNENVMSGFGIQHTTGDIVYKNCTFDGAVTNEYYGTVSYVDCTFTGTGYITTYAVRSANIENCVFNKADSRAVLVYSHGDNPVNVTIKGCQFNAAAKATTWAGDWTAAIEVDTTNIKTAGTTVTVEDCTADSNYSGLLRNKSSADATPAVITIDGVVQS